MKWSSWLRWSRKPASQSSPTACPGCGEEMVFIEKFTMMGDDRRTYRCKHCQKDFILDFGTALWKLMSDADTQDTNK